MLVGCVLQLAWCHVGGRGCCADSRACWGHKSRKKIRRIDGSNVPLAAIEMHFAVHLQVLGEIRALEIEGIGVRLVACVWRR